MSRNQLAPSGQRKDIRAQRAEHRVAQRKSGQTPAAYHRARGLDPKDFTLWEDVYAAVAPCALGFAAEDVDSLQHAAVPACPSLGVRTSRFRGGATSAHCAKAHEARMGFGRRLARRSRPAHGMRLDARWPQLPVARGSLGRAVRARAARDTPADAAWRWEGSASPAARDVPGR